MTSAPFALGKVPSEREFVHLGASTPAAHELDSWTADAMNRLRTAGYHGLPRTVRMLIPMGPNRLVACVAVPSSDAVLRAYPMVVGIELDPSGSASEAALGLDRYFSDAEAWIAGASQWPAGRLAAAFQALPAPTPDELRSARTSLAQALSTHSSTELDARLFGEGVDASSRRDAALRALRMAAQDAARSRRTVFVAFPVVIDVDLFAWLMTCERAGLLRRGEYGVAFCEEPTPRLIVALGRPDGQLLRFALDDDRNSRSFWPLMEVANALPSVVGGAHMRFQAGDGIGAWLGHATRVLASEGGA